MTRKQNRPPRRHRARRRRRRAESDMNGVGAYFSTLGERVGAAWNRFWFTPSDPFNLCVIRVLTGGLALALYVTYIPDLQQLLGPNGLLSENTVLHLRGSTKVFSIFDY